MARRKMRIKLLVDKVATDKGINRAKLARIADLNYETVHNLWRDPYRPVSILTLVKIAVALNVPVTTLYEIEQDT